MRIALDAMGGDFAPQAIVEGAILAARQFAASGIEIILLGDSQAIQTILDQHETAGLPLRIHPTTQVIEMGEHPTKALQQKTDSSIAVGFGLLKAKAADAFCSAGNTGAMMVGAMFSIKAIEGILRPAIMSFVPKEDGSSGVILDVGANADCKPEMLEQFGELGSLYAEHVLHVSSPKVGLMNLGEEEGKGTMVTQPAYQLLKANSRINFIGNIEGRDIFNNKADVIVTDGFTGNVVLKMAETIYDIMLSRNISDEYFNRFNYEAVGGSPIMGVNGNVIIGHGVSSPYAVSNMLNIARQMVESDISNRIKQAYSSKTTASTPQQL
jgi:glycerol-3-phosphate acyltransferase PlsX